MTLSPSGTLSLSDGVEASGSYTALTLTKGNSYGSTQFKQYYTSVNDYGLKLSNGVDDRFVFKANGTLLVGTTQIKDMHLGVGTALSPWIDSAGTIDFLQNGSIMGGSSATIVGHNLYFSDNWKYKANGSGGNLRVGTDGSLKMYSAPTGTAGGVATLTETFNVSPAGFTKLGGDGSPAIKMKKLTGATATAQSGTTLIAHGLDGSKILDVSVRVFFNTSSSVPPEYTAVGGYQFSAYSDGTNVHIKNSASNSSLILNKFFTVLITYEE
jgi:hypothetical protein